MRTLWIILWVAFLISFVLTEDDKYFVGGMISVAAFSIIVVIETQIKKIKKP